MTCVTCPSKGPFAMCQGSRPYLLYWGEIGLSRGRGGPSAPHRHGTHRLQQMFKFGNLHWDVCICDVLHDILTTYQHYCAALLVVLCKMYIGVKVLQLIVMTARRC